MDKEKQIFADATLLYEEAIAELERGNLRDAAEKSWEATLRATNALILARTGKKSLMEPGKLPRNSTGLLGKIEKLMRSL